MSGEYVPMSQRTPEQREAYLQGSRERNRRYYARKKERRSLNVALTLHLEKHGTVPCGSCGIEVIPICGFCRNGLDRD